jgi:hypothetical protein
MHDARMAAATKQIESHLSIGKSIRVAPLRALK